MITRWVQLSTSHGSLKNSRYLSSHEHRRTMGAGTARTVAADGFAASLAGEPLSVVGHLPAAGGLGVLAHAGISSLGEDAGKEVSLRFAAVG